MGDQVVYVRRRAPLLLRVSSSLVALVALVCAGLAGRAAWAGLVAPGPRVLAGQLDLLSAQLRTDSVGRQPDLGWGVPTPDWIPDRTPEGFVRSQAMEAMARVRVSLPGDQGAIAEVERALTALNSPATRAAFPADAAPRHGVVWAAWTLLVAVEHARLTEWWDDQDDVRARAVRLRRAVEASGTGFLEAAPGVYRPADTVVAVAALARADQLVEVPGARRVVSGWVERTRSARDPVTGLFPHRLGPDGVRADSPPRASSQALVLAFEADIDADQAVRDYQAFVRTFVVRRFGLVGAREFPRDRVGDAGAGSGPLVFGFSAVASVTALAAARSVGDRALAGTLESEIEFLGLPTTLNGGRRYLGGVVPEADTHIAWARSRPFPGEPATAPEPEPEPEPEPSGTRAAGSAPEPNSTWEPATTAGAASTRRSGSAAGTAAAASTRRSGSAAGTAAADRRSTQAAGRLPVGDLDLPRTPTWLWWAWCLALVVPLVPAGILVSWRTAVTRRLRAAAAAVAEGYGGGGAGGAGGGAGGGELQPYRPRPYAQPQQYRPAAPPHPYGTPQRYRPVPPEGQPPGGRRSGGPPRHDGSGPAPRGR
jgi:hypothetical protein